MSVIISKQANEELIAYLKRTGTEIEFFNDIPTVAFPVSAHPDMLYCWLKPGIVFRGDEKLLSPDYPLDIRFNACSTGKYFIHNLNYTDPGLLELSKELGLIPVNVRQGYSKCNIVNVDTDSIITSDEGIAISCKSAGLSVLLVSKENIFLPGYDAGFLGGCSGNNGREVIFNGNLAAHKDFGKIRDFIQSRGLRIRYFESYPLTDIGSLVFCE